MLSDTKFKEEVPAPSGSNTPLRVHEEKMEENCKKMGQKEKRRENREETGMTCGIRADRRGEGSG